MYSEYQRQLTEDEKMSLAQQANASSLVNVRATLFWLFVFTLVLAICVGAMAILISLSPTWGPILAACPGVIGFGCVLCIVMFLQGHLDHARFHRQFKVETRPQLLKAIEADSAIVREFKATRCIKLVPFEDEGAGFIYDIGDGSLVFLKGQAYEHDEEDQSNPWPNDHFSIVHTGCRKFLIDIELHGKCLEPIEEFDLGDCLDDIIWSVREDVLAGDLFEFTRSLLDAKKA